MIVTHHKLMRGLLISVAAIVFFTLLLVACGATPTTVSQPPPTSTTQLSTLPIAPSSSGQPTVTSNLSAPSAVVATATSAMFPPETVATTSSAPTELISTLPGFPTAVNQDTATPFPTPAVPTPVQNPPTVPIGISPGLPNPTVPIGISPAIGNNSAITEQRFTLNLNGFQAEASLEYPKAMAGPYPTILMFQPNGLYDLDATASLSRFGTASRNYKVIADQLAARGFAVIRYTKRNYDTSQQADAPLQDTPVDQLISDAKAAYSQIQTNAVVDPTKILLLGEDEGAVVAMRLAQQLPDVAGLILIAPITDPKVALHYQLVDAPLAYAHKFLDGNKDGALTVQEWSYVDAGTYLFSLENVAFSNGQISSLLDAHTASSINIDDGLKPYLESLYQKEPDNDAVRAKDLAALFQLGDNTATLANFKKPVLILQGSLDQQVPPSQSQSLNSYLTQQGNSDHTLIQYPKLGHSLYKLDRSGADLIGPIDANLPPPNNPVDDMISWLQTRFLQ